MRLLIIYPHGLGDIIMATPALRKYRREHPQDYIVLAMQARFESSEILKHCPYVDELLFTPDPWQDFGNAKIGFTTVKKFCVDWAATHNIDKVINPTFPAKMHKIVAFARAMGVGPLEAKPHTEIFTTQEDVDAAVEFIGDRGPFGFVHTTTGAPAKDLPKNYGRQWLKENKGLDACIEVGIDFKYDDFNINVQFEIVRRAEAICIPDSVFYHARAAMDKPVDLVYFQRGRATWHRVRALHDHEKAVTYNLKDILK